MGRRQRQTSTLTNNFLTTLYYLQSLLLHLPTRRTQLLAACGPLTTRRPWFFICQMLDSTDRSKTARFSRGHQYISCHNPHTFPLYHVTASVYFHRCVQSREKSMCDNVVKQKFYVGDIYEFLFLMTRGGVGEMVLYNCGGIFFILSFFVLYILSFGIVRFKTFRLSAWVRCTHWVQVFTHVRGGCDNHRCHNKYPR